MACALPGSPNNDRAARRPPRSSPSMSSARPSQAEERAPQAYTKPAPVKAELGARVDERASLRPAAQGRGPFRRRLARQLFGQFPPAAAALRQPRIAKSVEGGNDARARLFDCPRQVAN
jgi:hypothetical protein